MPRQRWEHCFMEVYGRMAWIKPLICDETIFEGKLEECAAFLEERGWELVGVVECHPGAGLFNFYFKRPVEE